MGAELDEMQEIVEDFIIETTEILEGLDQDLVQLEENPEDLELLDRIFRSVHTIKGTSSFLGFTQLTELAHRTEDVLNCLRHEEIRVTPEIMDVLLEAVDYIKSLVGDIKAGQVKEVDLSRVTDKLSRTLEIDGEGDVAPPAKPEEVEPTSQSIGETPAPDPSEKSSPEKPCVEPAGVGHKDGKEQADQTVRVDVERLDNLMNLVGELVLGRNRLVQLHTRMEDGYQGSDLVEQLGETSSQISFITTELQMAVMKTRMLPIGKVFNRFPRMVRDLAREKGKEVELVVSGEETELDKSVVDEISDPLVHLIRNAIDHGIEPPEERVRLGKHRKGTVRLYAYHEGNHIIIGVEDDGRGIDVERIKKKILEKGLVRVAELDRMSFQQALNFIFAPGFSTAEQVTDVSGRGVGMDVVKAKITRLNGMIEVDTQVGVGSRITIKLPLTLAIIQGLLVEVGEELFIIPLASVLETARIALDQVHTVDQKEVILLRGSVLPIIRLGDLFGVPPSDNGHRKLYVVIVGLAEKRYGLVVNALKGQEEVVIKPLGEYLGGVQGIAGAAIMGDGRVRLILDMAGVIELAQADIGGEK